MNAHVGTTRVTWLALALLSSPVALAADSPALAVRGAVPRPRAFALSELQNGAADRVTWTYRGQQQQVVGVPLIRLLAACGWERGPMTRETPARLKRAGLRAAVVASSPDGFKAVFSMAELDSVGGSTRAYIVWSADGAPLAEEFGRMRIAVLTDAEPSRSIHDVRELRVVDLSGNE